MPELPEVETVRRGLHALIIGRTFKWVNHDTPKSFPNTGTDVREFLVGAKVIDVRRRAKVLLIDLSTGYTLVIHLKMTGQLVFVASSSSSLPSLSTPKQTGTGVSISKQTAVRQNNSEEPSPSSAELALLKQSSNSGEAPSKLSGDSDSASSSDTPAPTLALFVSSRSSTVTRDNLQPESDQTPGLLSDPERSPVFGDGGRKGEQSRGNLEQPGGQGHGVRFGAGHPSDSLIGKLPDRSTRVTLEFTDGSHLYFNDQRKFGWMKLLPTLEVPNIDFMKKVGPEPLEADFTAEQFAACFTRRARTSIKAALLDQTVIAGVGNIYADESLWGAKIHPKRLVHTITAKEFQKLYEELRAVMNLAIEKGGSTDKNYVNAEGKRGSYMDFARVFRREGKPCPRCGTTIVKFKAAGRGTHICPHCQTL